MLSVLCEYGVVNRGLSQFAMDILRLQQRRYFNDRRLTSTLQYQQKFDRSKLLISFDINDLSILYFFEY